MEYSKKKIAIVCSDDCPLSETFKEFNAGMEFIFFSGIKRTFLADLQASRPDVILVHIDERKAVSWPIVCSQIASCSLAPIMCVCKDNPQGDYLQFATTIIREPINYAQKIAVVAELWRLAYSGAALTVVDPKIEFLDEPITETKKPVPTTLRFLEWTIITAALSSSLAGTIAYLVTQSLEKMGLVIVTVFGFTTLVLLGKPISQNVITALKNLTQKSLL